MEDNIKKNYDWHSSAPIKSKIVEVALENFKKINIEKYDKSEKTKHLTKEQMENIAKKLVEQHDAAYKMNRAEKRQAIRNIVKRIKLGKIKVDEN